MREFRDALICGAILAIFTAFLTYGLMYPTPKERRICRGLEQLAQRGNQQAQVSYTTHNCERIRHRSPASFSSIR